MSTVDIENPGLLAATDIMTEAYSRLGIQLKVVRLPAQRALPDANAGKYDGELYRVAEVARNYPNLRRVPTLIGSIDFVAYGKKPMLSKVTNWQSLGAYRLGAQLGIKFIEYSTKGMNVNFVSKGEQLIQMLYLDRIDIALMDRNTMFETLKRIRASGRKDLAQEVLELKVLETLPLYHYVHFKNEKEIPKIDAILQVMQKEGYLKKAWKDAKK
ncbi:MAG: substrate-binding periplasmic protein [Pseudobdellovibrionaceae bacterium]